MIDAAENKEFAAFERAQARREAKAAYAERRKGKEQARLEEARMNEPQKDTGELQVEETAAVLVPPAALPPRDNHDELAYLRAVRISLFSICLLVILLIWLCQQRRNS